MSTRTLSMTDALYEYLLTVSVKQTEVMRRLREETAQMTNGGMQISAEQGQFMSLLMKLIGAKTTLEIGVFTGYSALVVAQALPDDGRIIACDVSEEFTSVGRRYWQEAGIAHKIDLRIGAATDTLETLLGDGQAGTFDFVFIDADKPNYDAYYELGLKLLRSGGLIAVDNALWSGKVADLAENDESTSALRDLNAKIASDSRVEQSLLPIGDGLMLARKK